MSERTQGRIAIALNVVGVCVTFWYWQLHPEWIAAWLIPINAAAAVWGGLTYITRTSR